MPDEQNPSPKPQQPTGQLPVPEVHPEPPASADAAAPAISMPPNESSGTAPDVPIAPVPDIDLETPSEAPAVTQGTPFGAGTPAGQPTAPSETPLSSPDAVSTPAATTPHRPSKKPLLLLATAAAIVLATGGVTVALALSNRVTSADVTAAQHANARLMSDLDTITSTMSSVDAMDNDSDPAPKLQTMQTRLDDANKQYQSLQASHALHNNTVHQKFTAASKKWPAYAHYMKSNVQDMQTITPTLVSFTKDTETLTKSAPSSISGLGDYLTKYKSLLDTTNAKISAMHLSVSENQQELNALQQFLTSASSDVSTAQHDIAANNISAVESDLLKIATSESSFSTTISNLETALTNKEKSLDPFHQFEDLASALDSLSSTVNR